MRWEWLIVIIVFFFCEAKEIQAQKKLDSLLNNLANSKKANEIKDLQNIAFYYKENDLYKKALEYFEKVLVLAESNNQNILKASTKKDIASLFSKLGDYKMSLQYVREAVNDLKEKNELKLLGELYSQMAVPFINRSEYDSTTFYLNKASLINHRIGNKEGQSDNLYFEGMVEYKKGNTKTAIDYLTKALGLIKETNNKRLEMKIESYLATQYADFGNHVKATELYLSSIAIGEALELKSDLANAYKLYSESLFLGEILIRLWNLGLKHYLF